MTPGLKLLERVTKKWRAEARRHRAITPVNPIADTIDYCAAELEGALQDAARADAYLTVDEYATQYRASPQTVRTWCRAGKIPAERTPSGWLIRVEAA